MYVASFFAVIAATALSAQRDLVPIGVATVGATSEEPIRMSGYTGRAIRIGVSKPILRVF